MDTIKRINREALRQAKDSEKSQHHLTCYLVAAVLALVTYFALRYYKPGFVLSRGIAGQPQVDQLKLVLASLAVALLIILGYHFLF